MQMQNQVSPDAAFVDQLSKEHVCVKHDGVLTSTVAFQSVRVTAIMVRIADVSIASAQPANN